MGNCLGTDVKVDTGVDEKLDNVEDIDAAVAHVYGEPSYPVQLFLRGEDLADVDALTRSDPFVVVYCDVAGRSSSSSSAEVGRTECVKNSLSPEWATVIRLPYCFERRQVLRFVVVDLDKGQDAATVHPSSCKLIGEATTTLAEVIRASGSSQNLPLHRSGVKLTRGVIHVHAEQVANTRGHVQLSLSAKVLHGSAKNTSTFLKCSRMVDDNKWLHVFRTEVQKKNMVPNFDPVNISSRALCNGDLAAGLKLVLLRYFDNGRHKPVGETTVPFTALQAAVTTSSPLDLRLNGKVTGSLTVRMCDVREGFGSFLDYISSGTEIHFTVAVDFTSSNQHPSEPFSLHYMSPDGRPTPYEEAIMGVGHVLDAYDSDRHFPAFGFGARPKAPPGQRPAPPVRHFFPLNGSEEDPYCPGVLGVLAAYRSVFQHYNLSGPTYFTPTIEALISQAQNAPADGRLHYHVLLILTDGEIMDMQQTVDSLIDAARLPCSVMIVGVGDEKFDQMRKLDGDRDRLRSCTSGEAERDIVQFVEFRKYKNSGPLLAAELLRELPTQFMQYVERNGIMPGSHVGPPAAAAPPPAVHMVAVVGQPVVGQ